MSPKALRRLMIGAVILGLGYGIATLIGIGGPATDDLDDIELSQIFDRIQESNIDSIAFIGLSEDRRLRRTFGGWTINNLPADSLVMANFWREVRDTKIRDLVGRAVSTHRTLRLLDGESAGAIFYRRDGGVDTILVGSADASLEGSYIRHPREQEVYLADGEIRLYTSRTFDGWQNLELLSVDMTEVAEIDLARGDTTYTLIREGDGWTIDGVAADSDLVQRMAEAFSPLRANRVIAPDSSVVGGQPARIFEARSEDGAVLGRIEMYDAPTRRFHVLIPNDETIYEIGLFRGDGLVPTREALAGGE